MNSHVMLKGLLNTHASLQHRLYNWPKVDYVIYESSLILRYLNEMSRVGIKNSCALSVFDRESYYCLLISARQLYISEALYLAKWALGRDLCRHVS